MSYYGLLAKNQNGKNLISTDSPHAMIVASGLPTQVHSTYNVNVGPPGYNLSWPYQTNKGIIVDYKGYKGQISIPDAISSMDFLGSNTCWVLRGSILKSSIAGYTGLSGLMVAMDISNSDRLFALNGVFESGEYIIVEIICSSRVGYTSVPIYKRHIEEPFAGGQVISKFTSFSLSSTPYTGYLGYYVKISHHKNALQFYSTNSNYGGNVRFSVLYGFNDSMKNSSHGIATYSGSGKAMFNYPAKYKPAFTSGGVFNFDINSGNLNSDAVYQAPSSIVNSKAVIFHGNAVSGLLSNSMGYGHTVTGPKAGTNSYNTVTSSVIIRAMIDREGRVYAIPVASSTSNQTSTTSYLTNPGGDLFSIYNGSSGRTSVVEGGAIINAANVGKDIVMYLD